MVVFVFCKNTNSRGKLPIRKKFVENKNRETRGKKIERRE